MFFSRSRARGLFSKFFLAIWLAMSFACVVLLTIEAERASRLQARAQNINAAAIAFYAVSAAKDHEDEKTWQSRAFLKDLESRTEIRGWLFNAAGKEVSGHSPAQLKRLRRELPQFDSLRQKAESAGDTVVEPLSTLTLAANTATAPSNRRYTFVAILPRSRFGPWNALPVFQSLRVLAILVTAGLASGLLAMNMARPIANLRDTVQRLAQGDLSARISPEVEFRRDELGDLSRDFNLMAERLEVSTQEEKRLYQSQKTLLADVAHELRSPLARITVALELARDADTTAIPMGNEDEFSVSEAHNRIEKEVKKLRDLIDRLLTLSRLESGVQQRDEAPIDFVALVESVVEDADYEARPAKRVQLLFGAGKFDLQTLEGEDAWIVQGNAELLLSALENVVRNAVRHTAAESVVEVRLSKERNDEHSFQRWHPDSPNCFVSTPASNLQPPGLTWAVVSVRDHGAGVDEKELQQIFSPFYRSSGGRAKKDGGVGLGLAITLSAIEFHSGQIRACNSPGGGLMVEIRLPLSAGIVLPMREDGLADFADIA